MYIRKTYDVYVTQGYYFGVWEDLTYDDTMADAKQMLKDYNDNENVPHRIVKRRIPKK